MESLDYTRTSGRKLTYTIRANTCGNYSVSLGDKELLRGRDALAAGGRYKEPSKRKLSGAVSHAKQAIESLVAMDEI